MPHPIAAKKTVRPVKLSPPRAVREARKMNNIPINSVPFVSLPVTGVRAPAVFPENTSGASEKSGIDATNIQKASGRD
jgi:hypothetical protein